MTDPKSRVIMDKLNAIEPGSKGMLLRLRELVCEAADFLVAFEKDEDSRLFGKAE